MFVIFAWVNEHSAAAQFEEHVPLRFVGERQRNLGSQERVHLLFLHGIENLDANYRSQLSSLGYQIVDASDSFERAKANHAALDRVNAYERFCFLRWVVLEEYLRREAITEQVIHLDGDVIVNIPLENLMDDLSQRTFVLQGCPALTSITNHDWLSAYCEQLGQLCSDMHGYSKRAWSLRDGYQESAESKWSGFHWFRETISSDQDLISFLIHADRIPQDSPMAVHKNSTLYYFQNPLWPTDFNGRQLKSSRNVCFVSDGTDCFIDNKQIALWHFQSDFSLYASVASVLWRLHYPGKYPNRTMQPNARVGIKVLKYFAPKTRLQIYQSIRELNGRDANAFFGFADIYNAQHFWQSDVFTKQLIKR